MSGGTGTATTALKVASAVSSPSSPLKPKPEISNDIVNGEPKSNASEPDASLKSKVKITPEELTTPHELTAYVETLLDTLESSFDDMSSQILERMTQMSSRVDALETSIHDIINGDVATPSLPGTPGVTR